MPAAVPQFYFGGVDSRSNPLNFPPGRALRCRNWKPSGAGNLELRYGYSTATMSTVSASAIHTLIPYKLWPNTKYLLLIQGTTPKTFAIADGTVTTPTVKGVAFASSAKGSYYVANNRVHYGNGTDQKWFDGTYWRDNGIRALTAAEVQNVIITESVRESTSAERSASTATVAAGGALGISSLGGYFLYAAYFDTSLNELGPCTQAQYSTRLNTTSGTQTINFTSLPNLSSVNANWVKLLARTEDGGTNAYFVTNTSTAITAMSRASSTVTVTAAGHGLSTNDIVVLSSTGDTNYNNVFKVTVVDANTFTFTLSAGGTVATGTCKRIVSVANATTTGSISVNTDDTSIIVNADKGLAASSVGGTTQGYQFYGCIYNPNGGGHGGTRIAIGGRYKPTTRVNLKISNLPDLSGSDTEWVKLIGRTGDGGQVPYAVTDSAGNYIYAANTDTSIVISQASINGQLELPNDATAIPSKLDKFAVVGDYVWGASSTDATLYRSKSAKDFLTGDLLFRPEQQWSAVNTDTFPTGDTPSCIAEWDYELIAFTLSDCAINSDAAGIPLWRGPWNVGCAGKRAFTKTPYGPFWVTGDKQVGSLVQGLPTPVSDEYEKALLSQIGDSYLSTTEIVYERDPAKGIDRLRIKGQDSNGTPLTIYHDFRLRDERSPYGQGYEEIFVGPLATDYTMVQGIDSNGLMAIYGGSSLGRIFRLNSGANDAGTEFSADYIGLINGGPQRMSITRFDFCGDRNARISVGKTLKTSLASSSASQAFAFEQLTPVTGAAEAVQDRGADNFHFAAKNTGPTTVEHAFVRIQLDSHSTDGDLTLSVPPHIPLEDYGRIYSVTPLLGSSLGA